MRLVVALFAAIGIVLGALLLLPRLLQPPPAAERLGGVTVSIAGVEVVTAEDGGIACTSTSRSTAGATPTCAWASRSTSRSPAAGCSP